MKRFFLMILLGMMALNVAAQEKKVYAKFNSNYNENSLKIKQGEIFELKDTVGFYKTETGNIPCDKIERKEQVLFPVTRFEGNTTPAMDKDFTISSSEIKVWFDITKKDNNRVYFKKSDGKEYSVGNSTDRQGKELQQYRVIRVCDGAEIQEKNLNEKYYQIKFDKDTIKIKDNYLDIAVNLKGDIDSIRMTIIEQSQIHKDKVTLKSSEAGWAITNKEQKIEKNTPLKIDLADGKNVRIFIEGYPSFFIGKREFAQESNIMDLLPWIIIGLVIIAIIVVMAFSKKNKIFKRNRKESGFPILYYRKKQNKKWKRRGKFIGDNFTTLPIKEGYEKKSYVKIEKKEKTLYFVLSVDTKGQKQWKKISEVCSSKDELLSSTYEGYAIVEKKKEEPPSTENDTSMPATREEQEQQNQNQQQTQQDRLNRENIVSPVIDIAITKQIIAALSQAITNEFSEQQKIIKGNTESIKFLQTTVNEIKPLKDAYNGDWNKSDKNSIFSLLKKEISSINNDKEQIEQIRRLERDKSAMETKNNQLTDELGQEKKKAITLNSKINDKDAEIIQLKEQLSKQQPAGVLTISGYGDFIKDAAELLKTADLAEKEIAHYLGLLSSEEDILIASFTKDYNATRPVTAISEWTGIIAGLQINGMIKHSIKSTLANETSDVRRVEILGKLFFENVIRPYISVLILFIERLRTAHYYGVKTNVPSALSEKIKDLLAVSKNMGAEVWYFEIFSSLLSDDYSKVQLREDKELSLKIKKKERIDSETIIGVKSYAINREGAVTTQTEVLTYSE